MRSIPDLIPDSIVFSQKYAYDSRCRIAQSVQIVAAFQNANHAAFTQFIGPIQSTPRQSGEALRTEFHAAERVARVRIETGGNQN